MSDSVVREQFCNANPIDWEHRNALRLNRLLRISDLILRDIGRVEGKCEHSSFRTLVDDWYAYCRGEPFIFIPTRSRDKSPRTQWFNRRDLIKCRLRNAVLSMDFVSRNARKLLDQDDPDRHLVKDHSIPLKVIRCELRKLALVKRLTASDVEQKLIELYWLGVITKEEDACLNKNCLRASMPGAILTPRARYLHVGIDLCEAPGPVAGNWRQTLPPLTR